MTHKDKNIGANTGLQIYIQEDVTNIQSVVMENLIGALEKHSKTPGQLSTHVRFVVMNLKYNQSDCVPFLQQYSGAD